MTFVPVVKLSGITWNSISIRWKPPETSQVTNVENEEAENTVESRNYLDYITYYKLTRKTDDHEVICTSWTLNVKIDLKMLWHGIKRWIYLLIDFDFQLNVYQNADEMTSYLWRELSAATNYAFTVSACNHYTQECGGPSNIVTGMNLWANILNDFVLAKL